MFVLQRGVKYKLSKASESNEGACPPKLARCVRERRRVEEEDEGCRYS